MSSIGQKTVPMSNYFVQFIMKSVIIQIRWVGAHFKANMM
jgi:hypothetical protein